MPIRRGSKWGKKQEYEGIKFDSIKELNTYKVFKEMESNGEIQDLQVHVPIDIGVNTATEADKHICTFIVDFKYWNGKNWTYVDAKAVKKKRVLKNGTVKYTYLSTPIYKLKKKLAEAIYGIKIEEV